MKLTMTAALVILLASTGWGQSSETDNLKQKVEEQGRRIEELQQKLELLEHALLGGTIDALLPPPAAARAMPIRTAAVEIQPDILVVEPVESLQTTAPVGVAPGGQAPAQPQIAGFRFGGDFRFRFDAAVRSASPDLTGLQNIRGRYRLRLNIDRDLFPDLNFHMQLATGAVNNGITFDQDFAGGVTRHPFFLSEAFIEYRPESNLTLRGGKLEEVFADNSRFVFDDDVRFNGFNERWKLGKLEFRGGQYIFVHPNVYSVAAGSPYDTLAGLEPGSIARAATMFHQGLTFDTALSERWHNQFVADIQLFKNPNLIALTSLQQGFPLTISPAIGLMLSGPATGTGNATTSPTNAILVAPHYQVVHGAYKLDANSLGGSTRWPLNWSVQVARNVGTSELQDAIMTTLSIGRTQEKGDIRGLYTFAIKDANSIISQLTDDDLGTIVGANIATHHFRLDYALRRGIVFQNLIFRQTARRPSNPADSFFVPIGRGTPPTWRYQGQLAISF